MYIRVPRGSWTDWTWTGWIAWIVSGMIAC